MTSADPDIAQQRSIAAADVPTVLTALRAAGESTRLRILALLAQGELTVSELCRILGQTQPRVSRHLKLLVDAQLLDRHSEGTSAFYASTRVEPGRTMLQAVLALVDSNDPTIAGDRRRLDEIRADRAEAAGQYFERIAELWDGVRSLHVADTEVEAALLAVADQHRVDGMPIGSLLDIGTGTGRVLELFAGRVDRGLGIDSSKAMLNLARSNLTAAGHDHLSVRHGNIYALDVPPGAYDLAVLHHVLHFLYQPRAAITAAAAALRPGGLLIVVDFAPHQLESLRTDHAHRHLGFTDDEVANWCRQAGFGHLSATHLVPTTGQPGADQADDLLTVGLWTATRPEAPVEPGTASSPIAPESI